MEEVDIWFLIRSAFPILDGKNESKEITREEFREIIEHIISNNLERFVIDLILSKIEREIRLYVAPKFWSYFEPVENEMDGFERFKAAVEVLCNMLSLLMPAHMLERMEVLRMHCGSHIGDPLWYGEDKVLAIFKIIVRSTLHSQLPLNHQVVTEHFYRVAFKVFCHYEDCRLKTEANDSAEEGLRCGGCEMQMENCHCDYIIDVFHSTNRKLIELELLERISGEVLTSLIHKRIENHVQETCKGSFDTSYISVLENWLQTVVMGWLSRIYEGKGNSKKGDEKLDTSGGDEDDKSAKILLSDSVQASLTKCKHNLEHLLYETYTRTRIEDLFNIIIEYPDSDPAIEDLRVCLKKTDLRGFLTQKLQRALETRLLHPGVNTPDIITAYIAAIKALRQLDPTGVLLETVTQPIRQYLRCRDDTVRCVITNLTEEGTSDLAEELVRGSEAPVDEHGSGDCEVENWESWNPDPVDADPSKTSKSRRTSDIISMLVNVYGSKELFVNEYRTLLADRLLSQFNYNTEKEIRYLELLKLRFGDSQLHYCEVMLKDVYDSKRINVHLHSDPNFELNKQPFPTTALILSAQFWPPFKDDSLELPSVVKERLAVYTKAFEMLKGNRTLNWKPHLGSVNLDITLKDRTINLTVSPIHAAIIWHFQTKSQWTVEELSQLLHVPATALRRRIAFWQSQGLLREISTDCFLLIEESASRSKCVPITEMVCEDEETESAMASAHDQREEELQVFWSYIVGMLTNLDSMPLERIHQMLKMFASQGPTSVECSLQELRHFLDRKVREHKLLFSGGFYRLPKS